MGIFDRLNRRPVETKLTGAHSKERALETPQDHDARQAQEKAESMTPEQHKKMMAEANQSPEAAAAKKEDERLMAEQKRIDNMAEAAVGLFDQKHELRKPAERAKNPNNLPELPQILETMGKESIREWSQWNENKLPLLGRDKERKAAAAAYVEAHPDVFAEDESIDVQEAA